MVLFSLGQVGGDSISSLHGVRHKLDRRVQSFTGLRHAEANKTVTRVAKTLTAQARHTARIISPFQEIHGQSMRSYLETIADFGNRRKRIKGTAGHETMNTVDLIEPVHQQPNLPAKVLHATIAFRQIMLHCGDTGQLRKGWDAGEGRVGQLGDLGADSFFIIAALLGGALLQFLRS